VARIPFFAMLGAPLDGLERRARSLAETLGARAAACETEAFAGGGAAPLRALPSWGVRVDAGDAGAATLAARLRRTGPRVLGRISDGSVVIDLRTVPPERDADVRAALAAALS
jgi:L-seryl-tRNA(Ser) seleniumtransferase